MTFFSHCFLTTPIFRRDDWRSVNSIRHAELVFKEQ